MSRRAACLLATLLAVLSSTTEAWAMTIVIQVCRGQRTYSSQVKKPKDRLNLSIGLGAFVGLYPGEYDKMGAVMVGGADIDVRYYMARELVFGGRVVVGMGRNSDGSGSGSSGPNSSGSNDKAGFGILVAPVIGLHWTRQEMRRVRNAPGSYYRGATRCDLHYRRHVFKSHVIGVEPTLAVAGKLVVGGHVVWEYDYFNWGLEGRYALTGRTTNTIDLRLRSIFKVGYLLGLGVGGGWFGRVSWGVLDLEMGFGVYYQGKVAMLASGTMGIRIF